jgi:hypothetical protein
MSRKCDRAKYRRRAKDARANRDKRQHRLLVAEAEHRRRVEEHRRRELEAREADPRYQLLGQLVGILQARLHANPAYQLIKTARLLGCEPEQFLDDVLRMARIEKGGLLDEK